MNLSGPIRGAQNTVDFYDTCLREIHYISRLELPVELAIDEQGLSISAGVDFFTLIVNAKGAVSDLRCLDWDDEGDVCPTETSPATAAARIVNLQRTIAAVP